MFSLYLCSCRTFPTPFPLTKKGELGLLVLIFWMIWKWDPYGHFFRERHDKQCFFSVFEVISLIFVQFNLVKFWENGRKTDPLSLPLSVPVIQFNTHTLSLNSVQSVKSMQSSLMIILLQQDYISLSKKRVAAFSYDERYNNHKHIIRMYISNNKSMILS